MRGEMNEKQRRDLKRVGWENDRYR